jgi:hypothetical protein
MPFRNATRELFRHREVDREVGRGRESDPEIEDRQGG